MVVYSVKSPMLQVLRSRRVGAVKDYKIVGAAPSADVPSEITSLRVTASAMPTDRARG